MAKSGGSWSSPKARRWLGPVLALVAGCATDRSHVDQALLATPPEPASGRQSAEGYATACPDALEVAVAGRPDLSRRYTIDPAGCIELGNLGRLRVEGLPVRAVADKVAVAAGVAAADVRVRVAEFRSQRLYLFGQVAGVQRAVAYEGPETVPEMLRRVGGIGAGAAPADVYVIRSHVADGGQAEVFHVDLQAIVLGHDARTNLHLQPSDQVYVGESRRSSLEKCVPPCFRPIYELLCGLRGSPAGPASGGRPPPEPALPDGSPLRGLTPPARQVTRMLGPQ